MNCYDCNEHGNDIPAIAVCHDCGAGVCIDHADTHTRYLTRMVGLGMPIEVEPPARIIRCATCSNAIEALRHASHSRPHSRTTQPIGWTFDRKLGTRTPARSRPQQSTNPRGLCRRWLHEGPEAGAGQRLT